MGKKELPSPQAIFRERGNLFLYFHSLIYSRFLELRKRIRKGVYDYFGKKTYPEFNERYGMPVKTKKQLSLFIRKAEQKLEDNIERVFLRRVVSLLREFVGYATKIGYPASFEKEAREVIDKINKALEKRSLDHRSVLRFYRELDKKHYGFFESFDYYLTKTRSEPFYFERFKHSLVEENLKGFLKENPEISRLLRLVVSKISRERRGRQFIFERDLRSWNRGKTVKKKQESLFRP